MFTDIVDIKVTVDGSLYESTIRSAMSVDIDVSIHIRNDRDGKQRPSIKSEGDSRHVVSSENDLSVSSDDENTPISAKKKFERELLHSRLSDLSQAFPVFTKKEVLVGRFLGHGSTAQVSRVNGLQIQNPQLQGEGENECPRSFMVKHCRRESGDARYAIKAIRKEIIAEEGKELWQAITDLNLETRFLAHLTAHPHANVMKLRAVASGDRFSPSYFILIDRLYDTLETRLVKWIQKAQSLNSLTTRLRSSLGACVGRHSLKNELFCKRFELLDDQLKTISGLSSAIAHLHKHGVMHRDIKSTNMGFNVRNNIMLFDLALAREIPDTTSQDGTILPSAWKFTQMVGTPRYMAPEVALGEKYNEKCDVFSFGILMWQIMGLEKRPYGNQKHRKNVEFLRKRVWQGAIIRPSMHFMNRIAKDHFCLELQDLVVRCWSHRWEHRPSMATVEANLTKFVESRINPDMTGFMSAEMEDHSFRYSLKGISSPK